MQRKVRSLFMLLMISSFFNYLRIWTCREPLWRDKRKSSIFMDILIGLLEAITGSISCKNQQIEGLQVIIRTRQKSIFQKGNVPL